MDDIHIRELDFSEYHPLDHTLWECTGYTGGRRRHLAYRWEFQWSGTLYAHTTCRIGRHHVVPYKTRTDVDSPWRHGHLCAHCLTDMTEET